MPKGCGVERPEHRGCPGGWEGFGTCVERVFAGLAGLYRPNAPSNALHTRSMHPRDSFNLSTSLICGKDAQAWGCKWGRLWSPWWQVSVSLTQGDVDNIRVVGNARNQHSRTEGWGEGYRPSQMG